MRGQIGEMQQAGSSKGGGAVMWPGLCTEFWWRTRSPVDKAWRSGQVEKPQVAAAAAGVGQKQQSP